MFAWGRRVVVCLGMSSSVCLGKQYRHCMLAGHNTLQMRFLWPSRCLEALELPVKP